MAQNGILKSSLAKKYAMAATGLFLCLFLVGHLAGNLQLFTAASDGGRQFNEYAKFMTTFPAVKVLSYLTYLSVLFHLVDGVVLSIQNRKARPVRYAMERASTNANWSSRNMMLLGTIVLVFLVTHMQNFWWQMHFGEVGTQTLRGWHRRQGFVRGRGRFLQSGDEQLGPARHRALPARSVRPWLPPLARIFQRIPIHRPAPPALHAAAVWPGQGLQRGGAGVVLRHCRVPLPHPSLTGAIPRSDD